MLTQAELYEEFKTIRTQDCNQKEQCTGFFTVREAAWERNCRLDM